MLGGWSVSFYPGKIAMEIIDVKVSEERYDTLVHGSDDDPVLPQFGRTDLASIEIAAKPRCTANGAACVVISFYCVLPDGRRHRVQAVTSRAAFLGAAQILCYHPDLS